jgi:capsular exopolysaccharide synthesis family protein
MKIATARVSDEVAFHEGEPIPSTTLVPIVQSLQTTSSVAGEEMRVLKARLERISSSRGLRCVGVVSALPGDGKSTVSLGLAAALAREKGRRILLIDCDLRRASISQSLGLASAPGLNDWLEGVIDEAPVHLVEAGGFFLLPAGSSTLARPEVLCSPRMEALLRTARKSFDFVVLDTTPVLPVSDAMILQELVDGFLLVIRARHTPREAILECLARLRPDAVVGVVLNDCQEPRSSYRSHAYQKYGLTYDYEASKGSGSPES